MKNQNGVLERTISGIGWGLFFILIGVLVFAQNKGWTNDHGWLYFFIGLGAILVIGFLIRYLLGNKNLWNALSGLVAGLALIYIGIAFLYGFGDWWPLALLVIGIGILVKGIMNRKRVLMNGEKYPEKMS